MYDIELFKLAIRVKGMRETRLSKQAHIHISTLRKFFSTPANVRPDAVYRIAKALDLPVTKTGDGQETKYDFTSIMKKRTA